MLIQYQQNMLIQDHVLLGKITVTAHDHYNNPPFLFCWTLFRRSLR